MIIKNIKKNKAFTLFELLIYVAVLSVIVVIISNTFISLSKGRGQSQARSEVNNALRFSSELLRQDIKSASSISVPVSGGSSSSITLIRDGVTIIYDVSGGALRRQVGAASPSNITNNFISVSTPTFTRIENTNNIFSKTDVSIKVNMTFNYNSTSPDWSYSTSLQTTINQY